MVAAGGIDTVVSRLRRPDTPVVYASCATVLRNVSRNSTVCLALAEAGAVEALLPLLSSSESVVRKAASLALANASLHSAEVRRRMADSQGNCVQ